MKKTNKLSKGIKKLSPAAHFLLKVYFPSMSETVAVPASISNQLLVFNIEQELERVEEFKNLAKEDLVKVISLIASASGMLDREKLTVLIQDSGFKGAPEAIEDLVKQIEGAVTRNLLQGAFSRIFLKDALSANERNLQKFSMPRLTDIEVAIWEVQEMYGRFATSMPVDTVITTYNDSISKLPGFDIARELHKLFNLNLTSTVQVRKSYALDSIFEFLSGQKNVDINPVVSGILYDVNAVHRFKNLSYSSALTAHITMMRIIEKIPSSVVVASPNLQQTVDAMVLGTADIAPFLPPQLPNASSDDVEGLISELFVYFLVRRVLANDTGSTYGAFDFIIDARKYKRVDTNDAVVRDVQVQCSFIFEAFLDAASYLKELCTDDSLQFDDIHPVLQSRINKFYWTRLGSYKNIQYGRDDSKYLMDVSMFINHQRFESLTTTEESYCYTDAQLEKFVGWPTSFKNFSAIEFLKGTTVKGSERVADISVDIALLGRLNSVTPSYYVEVKNPSLITDYEIFIKYLGLVPLKKLKKMTEYFDMVRDRGEIVILQDKYDIAARFKLPLHLAEKLLKHKDEIFIAFKSLQTSVFTWKGEIAPIYEFTMKEETTLVQPHLSFYPFLVSSEYLDGEGHNFTSIEGSVLDLTKENDKIRKDLEDSKTELAAAKIELEAANAAKQ